MHSMLNEKKGDGVRKNKTLLTPGVIINLAKKPIWEQLHKAAY